MDKTDWGDGPWQTEPDEVAFEHAGYDCLILRVEHMGHLCGYVRIPDDHPWYRKGYDDIPAEVHGGLTYANEGVGKVKAGWWVGFDTAHYMDLAPFLIARGNPATGGEYRTIDYVRAETMSLAGQVAKEAK